MLKKIYKNFLENWISYGFETLVVIIGIIIALTLQNWNDGRKEATQELKYLKSLRTNLSQDTAYFRRSMQTCKELIVQNQSAKKIAYDEQKTLEEFREFLDQLVTYTIPFKIQDATYFDMISTGNINILRNDSLKTQIIQYYKECEYREKDMDNLNEFVSQITINASTKGLSWAKYNRNNSLMPGMINPKDWAYMDDYDSPEFKAMYQMILFSQIKNQFFMSDFAALNESAKNLLTKLDKELEKRD
jgi:hypothetical protein